jgi:NACHT domain
LGLIERKERPKVKEEPSPEHGSQLYQTEYTETKRFEHEAFLAEVVGKPVGGKHIAIIGEPGAGKTTILTKIGAWLIQQAEQQPPAPLVVAWISLADVGDRRLQAYLRDEWLQKVCEDNFDAAWEDWKGLRQQGRVWLLLDGLDEMSGDALAAIHPDLGLAWAQNLRVVMTCRINQWETAASGNILTNSFDVYRTLDYSYQTSQGDDQVKEFISKWFATQIRTELDAPGKERIKDLVKNPLRLTLLCASWEKDNQALPETQAGLYEKFIDYLYDWKAVEFFKDVELREEIDLALGKLAKEGLNRQPMNDVAVRRFRFTTSEIRGLWGKQSKELIAAAKNLGWLNVVEKDTYAFYHPTFQEYFAACAIDDWDYFLPRAHIDRPVPCQGESVPIYRVFEQEWRQVILLWIGRISENVPDKLKEEFIDRLTDFRAQEGKFYYYRAYFMAAICVGEFRSSQWAEEIVREIVTWAFGSFETKKQKRITYLDLEPISSFAQEMIPFTHRGYAINTLTELLENPELDNWMQSGVSRALDIIAVNRAAISTSNEESLRIYTAELLSRIVVDRAMINAFISMLDDPNPEPESLHGAVVVEALGQIAVGDRATIDALISMMENPKPGRKHREYVSRALGQIAVGDRVTINTLTELLENPELDEWLQYRAIVILGQIAVGDRTAINTLTALLENPELGNPQPFEVANALGKIEPGNRAAISTLTALLENPEISDALRPSVGKALGRTLTAQTIPSSMWQLKKNITNEVYNSNIKLYYSCYKAVFNCAQTLSYPEFHTAWHKTHLSHQPFTPKLEKLVAAIWSAIDRFTE